jgi:hypothetical protein
MAHESCAQHRAQHPWAAVHGLALLSVQRCWKNQQRLSERKSPVPEIDRTLHYSPEKVSLIIYAGWIIYNLMIHFGFVIFLDQLWHSLHNVQLIIFKHYNLIYRVERKEGRADNDDGIFDSNPQTPRQLLRLSQARRAEIMVGVSTDRSIFLLKIIRLNKYILNYLFKYFMLFSSCHSLLLVRSSAKISWKFKFYLVYWRGSLYWWL